MTPEQELYYASRAKEVLENESYILAWTEIRKELFDQWEQTPARDTAGRESLWIMVKQLDKLRITLESSMSAGKLAEVNLRYKEQTKLQKAVEFLTH